MARLLSTKHFTLGMETTTDTLKAVVGLVFYPSSAEKAVAASRHLMDEMKHMVVA